MTPFGQLHPVLRRILLLNVLVFFLVPIDSVLFQQAELRVAAVLSRPWTLVTYSFLHGGFFHLFINMLMLWMFGNDVAHTLGGRRFVAFYLFAAFIAGLCSLPFYGGSVVGASGALFGAMFFYAQLFPDRVMLLFFVLPMRMRWGIWVLALFDLWATRSGDGIAHWAHLGGFLAGILAVQLYFRTGPRQWLASFQRWQRERLRKTDTLEPEIGFDVNHLLKKISEQGIESLSRSERDALMRESERRRRNREEYHRWR